MITLQFEYVIVMSEEDSDSTAANDDDDDENGIDSSTGNCLASASQHIYLPETRLQFDKCRDINADRPAKVACSVLVIKIFCN